MQGGSERIGTKRRVCFTAEWLGGKLVGTRAGDLRTLAEWRDFGHRVRQVVSAREVVICADLRGLQVLGDELHAPLVETMRRFNRSVLRSAILVPYTSPLRLRIERMLRDANHPVRQLCADAAEVKAWLCSSLDARERQLLDEYLSVKHRAPIFG